MTDNSSPIACNLSEPEERNQRDVYRRNLTPFLTDATYAAGTSRLAFSKPDVTRQMLEHLVASEQDCCAFLNFDLSETATHFHLDVSGPEGSEDIIRKFFSSSSGSTEPACGCAGADQPRKTKTKKYFARFITICAIACAVPPTLAAVGLIGVATVAYLGKGIEAVLIVLALMGLGFLLIQFVKKRLREASS